MQIHDEINCSDKNDWLDRILFREVNRMINVISTLKAIKWLPAQRVAAKETR